LRLGDDLVAECLVAGHLAAEVLVDG
jgi:hypothetical protein